MHWGMLFVAGLFEIAWAIGLKYSEGFSKLVPSVLTVIGMIASFYFLAVALKNLPLGTAYAIWTGIGTLGTTFIGILVFKEPASAIRLACIGCIFIGIVGLKLVSPQ